MKIRKFVWLEQYVEKLEVKHGVSPEEVEELFTKRPKIRKVQKGFTIGEDVYRAIGQTNFGRYLFVIFIYKSARQEVLAVSARTATKKERKSYGKK